MTPPRSSSPTRAVTTRARLGRLRRVRRMRGAAMVEAAVVLPVLVVFIGLMIFVRAQYSAKLYAMADSRQNAWDRAVHAQCGGGSGGSSAPSLDVPEPPNGTREKVLDPGPSEGAKKQGMDRILRKVEFSKSGATSYKGYAGTVSSHSYVFCNEENYADGGLWGILKGFVGFVSSFWRGGLL